jgi:hypothetical protein
MEFGIALTGDREVVLRFQQFPKMAHDRLLVAMKDIEMRLEAAVKSQMPKKSSKMLGQTGGRVYDHDNRIAAVVGVRAPDQNDALKAQALEFGSHKTFTVRAHQMKLDHFWHLAISPIDVTVKRDGVDGARKTNLPALRFLRGPLHALEAQAVQQMQEAIDAAAQDALG